MFLIEKDIICCFLIALQHHARLDFEGMFDHNTLCAFVWLNMFNDDDCIEGHYCQSSILRRVFADIYDLAKGSNTKLVTRLGCRYLWRELPEVSLPSGQKIPLEIGVRTNRVNDIFSQTDIMDCPSVTI